MGEPYFENMTRFDEIQTNQLRSAIKSITQLNLGALASFSQLKLTQSSHNNNSNLTIEKYFMLIN